MQGYLPSPHLMAGLLSLVMISFPSFHSFTSAQPLLMKAEVHRSPSDGMPRLSSPRVDVTINGTVSDQQGNPLPGVTIVVEGDKIGTVTDIEGKYNLSVPEGATLVFSFVGYRSETRAVGSQSVINVTLQEDLTGLEEVVVTALGIKREAKSLGYATSAVESEEMTINRTPNFMNSLQGKVAGVNITSLGSGPAGTSKIRIRGQSSVGGQNQPLIVVNGVPIDNTNFGANPN